MKKIRIFAAAAIAAAAAAVSCVFADAMMLEYDGGVYEYDGAVYQLVVKNKKVEPALEPIIFNDRALVPVRDVFEEVGATVNYRSDTQTVEVIDGNTYIRMNINDNIAYVNGSKTAIPDSVVPKLISKVGGETKTMVPVRFISETIGLDVEFDGDKGAILVESRGYDENAPTPTPEITPIPTKAPVPTAAPTAVPTAAPTAVPTAVPTAAPTAVPTAVPTAAPTPEPTPEPVRVSSITYKNVSSGKIAITVEMNKEAKYSYFTLSDPERLVVDIQGAELLSGEQTMYVNNGGVKAVRVGVNPQRTRVVVDMDKIENYGFGKDGNNLIIYAKASAAASPSATAQPQSTPKPTPVPTAKPENTHYNKNLIVLDAGHGGFDPGAQGTLDGKTINESDIALQITYKVKGILESDGYKVVLTRSDDTYKTLIERPALANEKNAGLFVSIHINSVDSAPEANGTEVYYAESNNGSVGGVTSSMLAKNILNAMLKNMGSTNRGVKTAEHAVTKRTDMPSCLAEVGFITNADEIAKMTDESYQYKAAQGIAEGIMKTASQMR